MGNNAIFLNRPRWVSFLQQDTWLETDAFGRALALQTVERDMARLETRPERQLVFEDLPASQAAFFDKKDNRIHMNGPLFLLAGGSRFDAVAAVILEGRRAQQHDALCMIGRADTVINNNRRAIALGLELGAAFERPGELLYFAQTPNLDAYTFTQKQLERLAPYFEPDPAYRAYVLAGRTNQTRRFRRLQELATSHRDACRRALQLAKSAVQRVQDDAASTPEGWNSALSALRRTQTNAEEVERVFDEQGNFLPWKYSSLLMEHLAADLYANPGELQNALDAISPDEAQLGDLHRSQQGLAQSPELRFTTTQPPARIAPPPRRLAPQTQDGSRNAAAGAKQEDRGFVFNPTALQDLQPGGRNPAATAKQTVGPQRSVAPGPQRGQVSVPGTGPQRAQVPVPGTGPQRAQVPVPGTGHQRAQVPVPGTGPQRAQVPVPGTGPQTRVPTGNAVPPTGGVHTQDSVTDMQNRTMQILGLLGNHPAKAPVPVNPAPDSFSHAPHGDADFEDISVREEAPALRPAAPLTPIPAADGFEPFTSPGAQRPQSEGFVFDPATLDAPFTQAEPSAPPAAPVPQAKAPEVGAVPDAGKAVLPPNPFLRAPVAGTPRQGPVPQGSIPQGPIAQSPIPAAAPVSTMPRPQIGFTNAPAAEPEEDMIPAFTFDEDAFASEPETGRMDAPVAEPAPRTETHVPKPQTTPAADLAAVPEIPEEDDDFAPLPELRDEEELFPEPIRDEEDVIPTPAIGDDTVNEPAPAIREEEDYVPEPMIDPDDDFAPIPTHGTEEASGVPTPQGFVPLGSAGRAAPAFPLVGFAMGRQAVDEDMDIPDFGDDDDVFIPGPAMDGPEDVPEPVVKEEEEPDVIPEPVAEEEPEVIPEPVVEEEEPEVIPEPAVEEEEPEGISEPVVEEEPEGIPEPVIEEEPEIIPEPVAEEEGPEVIPEPAVEEEEPEVIPEPVLEEEPEGIPEPVSEEELEVIPEPVVEEEPVGIPEPVVEEEEPEVIPEPVVEEEEPEVIPEPVAEEEEPEVIPEPAVEEEEPEGIPEPVAEEEPEVIPESAVEEEPEVIPEPVAEEEKPEVTPDPVIEEEPDVTPEPVVEEEEEPEVIPEPVVEEEEEPEVIPEPVIEEEPEVIPEPVIEEEPEVTPGPVVEEEKPEVIPEPVVEEEEPEDTPEPEVVPTPVEALPRQPRPNYEHERGRSGTLPTARTAPAPVPPERCGTVPTAETTKPKAALRLACGRRPDAGTVASEPQPMNGRKPTAAPQDADPLP